MKVLSSTSLRTSLVEEFFSFCFVVLALFQVLTFTILDSKDFLLWYNLFDFSWLRILKYLRDMNHFWVFFGTNSKLFQKLV